MQFRSFLVLMAIKIGKHLRTHSGSVLFLSGKLCVKYGPFTQLSEAATLRYIADRTSIPVPKVYYVFTHKDKNYILMERIDGQMLGAKWLKTSKESKEKLLNQLRLMVEEMRRLPRPRNIGIANTEGGELYDCRLGGLAHFGPFSTVDQFHRFLRNGIAEYQGNNSALSELMSLHSENWPINFTHGDLSSLNILAKNDKIVGIIDWECAGWLPSYWEYTQTYYVNPRNEFWREEVDRFLTPQPKELHMEALRRDLFGDI